MYIAPTLSALVPFKTEVGEQRGWVFDARGGRGQPPVALQYANRRDRRINPYALFIIARLHIGPTIGFWTWIDDWWGQASIVHPTHTESSHVLPPLTAREAMDQTRWTRWCYRQLARSQCSPVHNGRWWLGSSAEWPFAPGPKAISEALHPPGASWFSDFEQRVVATRRVDPADRRVGFWRKQIRAGARPPALLLYLALTETFAILDGHARLLAAHLEGVELPLLLMTRVREVTYASNLEAQAGAIRHAEQADWDKATERSRRGINQALIRLFGDPRHVYPRTRAWPLGGGWNRWNAEIAAHMARLPAKDAEHAADLQPPVI